jgi:hypothetical protein
MARVAALAAVSVVLATAPAARADTAAGPLPNGGTFEFRELFIKEDGDDEFTQPSEPLERDKYFNLAHCVCGSGGAGDEQELQLSMTVTGAVSPLNRPGDVWLGADCSSDQLRDTNCLRDDGQAIGDLSTLENMIVRRTFQVFDVIAPVAASCPVTESTANVWVLSDTDGSGTYDWHAVYPIDFDTQAAPAPANATAESGENAVQVNWDPPIDRADDVAYYQALCARADTGEPAHAARTHAPRYETSTQLCPTLASREVILTGVANKRSESAAFGPTPDGAPDAGPVDAAPAADAAADAMPSNLPAGLEALEDRFICGEETAPASSMRIGGLENGVAYRIVVVAIDLSGNAAGIYFSNPITPQPVTDFWEDLHDQGSEVEGGFCLIAETYGKSGPLTQALRGFRDQTLADTAFGRWLTRVYYGVSDALGPLVHGSIVARVIAAVLLAPLVVIGLLWHVLTLPGLIVLLVGVRWLWKHRRGSTSRRSRTPRLLAAATLVSLLALGGTASAQSSNDPFWSDPVWDDADDDEILDPHWHVGLRFGPYIPEIDKQLGGDPGPYEQMFGSGSAVMPVLDVDWLFYRGFGQLGIGGSVGAMWRSAQAYEAGTDPNDPMRPRSEGDGTNFRLVPLAATVVYRFTYLDDNYGIPVVPYVRGGLSYYIWWIGAPSGNTAVIRDPAGCDPDEDGCSENRARGGTIGVQGSIGLAIRAERIDAGAARSMRQGGVEHAGFYAELSLAKVDGFGNDKKLSVGDRTWFVGVDFEF